MFVRPMARHYRNPALSVDAVWIRGGSVLLVRRGRPPFKGRWAFPGGFVEYYETVEEAIQREVREETGLEIRPVGLVGVYSGPDRDPRHPTTSVVFFVTGAPRLPEGGDDAAEARWVPLRDAHGLAFDHDRILADARRLKARAPRRTARP
jgi:8-oxo-dGTP diphosphatase